MDFYFSVHSIGYSLITFIVSVVLLIGVFIFMVVQSIKQGLDCFLRLNQKEIAVKRMHGYSIYKTFKDYLLMMSLSLLIVYAILALYLKSVSTLIPLIIVSTLLVLLIVVIKMRKVYKVSLSTIFKGKDI